MNDFVGLIIVGKILEYLGAFLRFIFFKILGSKKEFKSYLMDKKIDQDSLSNAIINRVLGMIILIVIAYLIGNFILYVEGS